MNDRAHLNTDVILLNGPSSAGKSSVAALLRQKLCGAGTDAVILSLDDYLQMSADEPIWEDDVFEVSGPMCRGITAALEAGKTVIVDHVITSPRIFGALQDAVRGFRMKAVLVRCSPELLRKREAARGDRCAGSAEASLRYLYPQTGYDLCLDSGAEGPAALADRILDSLSRPDLRAEDPGTHGGKNMQISTVRTDYHMHCRFSTDSEAEPEAMCEAAIARGLTGICFTDHQDLGFDDPAWFRFDPEAYFRELRRVQASYAGRLEVRIGVEIGLLPDDPRLAREAEALAKDWPWDFIIGSTHQIPVRIGGHTEYVDPADPAQALRSWYHFGSVKALMTVYYETVLKNLEQFDCFDTLGHIDYMSRYVPKDLPPYRFEDHEAEIERILRTAAAKGTAIEVNTGGLYKGNGKTNPEERIIRRYLALGGTKLTYGSDAHRPEHVGFGFDTLPDYGKPAR